MQTANQERTRLMRMAEQYQQEMRKRLEQIYKPGKGQPIIQAALSRGEFGYQDPRGLTKKFGTQVTDADVEQAIRKAGGNPYMKQLRELDAKRTTGSVRPPRRVSSGVVQQAAKSEQNLLAQLAAEYQAQQDEANYQNQLRYDEGHGELSTLRDRNSERVKNFGKAAQADLEERFSKNLGDVTANLSSRGLGNSTIVSAFEAKNARDLAREQQRLSEMVDDRASRYDTSDTQNLVGFVERRDDVAPDFSQLAALAQAYGSSGASGVPTEAPVGGGAAGGASVPVADTGPPRSTSQWNLPYATSAWNANRIANSYQGAYPSLQQMMRPQGIVGAVQQGVNNMLAPMQTTPAWESNRQPYEWLDRKRALNQPLF